MAIGIKVTKRKLKERVWKYLDADTFQDAAFKKAYDIASDRILAEGLPLSKGKSSRLQASQALRAKGMLSTALRDDLKLVIPNKKERTLFVGLVLSVANELEVSSFAPISGTKLRYIKRKGGKGKRRKGGGGTEEESGTPGGQKKQDPIPLPAPPTNWGRKTR